MGRELREVASNPHSSLYLSKLENYMYDLKKKIFVKNEKLREVASNPHSSLLPKATVDPQTEVDQGCLLCTQVTIRPSPFLLCASVNLTAKLARLDTMRLSSPLI